MDISQKMPARHQEIHHLQETEIMDELRSPSSCRDDIVITGISGRFPESNNMEEFQKNLFEGVDMVTDDDRRYPAGIYGLPTRTGKLKNITHFDASFFGVNPKQADVMDPQLRMLLEITYEAIIDAGINPNELRGSKTGVFIGGSTSETADYLTRDPQKVNGYGLLGCAKAMFANRISFTFDFKGPSFLLDTACSSSLMALHQAVLSIRLGECDSAIVGGANLLLKPTESLQFHRINMLSPNGACKTFDASGDGYVRAEACAAVLLQKAADAKRVYATIVNTGANTDGYKEEGITFPYGLCQKTLILDVFQKGGINPSELVYIEAHGTGTKVGDPQEVNSIGECFGKSHSNTPLLIGSVKSNMGHSEPASGLCSLAKVLIAMETGVIPGNLHYNNPHKDIPALSDGTLQVVDKNWNWNVGLTAVNSFGFGGANVHLVLKPNPKPKIQPMKHNLPRLITVSGRTYESVDYLLSKIENMPRDEELITLIHDIHKKNISGHFYRGYSVLDSDIKRREITDENIRKELWYIFSGMGSQWAGMGQAFMSLEPFSKAIHKCAAVLMDEGVDLLNLIYHGDEKTISDNILYSFVCIAAIQVALVDLLTALGLAPDGIIGHSTGELGCAYADGTFTAEQTVLAAYWRGRSIIDSKLEHGAMAAVGMNWDEVQSYLPQSCVVACHNGAESITVSGPVKDMDKFVDELKQRGVFVKKVESSGIAFHSKYIADAGPKLRSNLERIIPVAKPRSKKWVSSSIPESGWSTQLAAYSSAAYHVNNLLSAVLFHEALTHIPENAVVVEVGPHCLLQAILKRDLPKSCTNIGLVKKNIPDEMAYLLGSVGKLYLSGLNPDLSVFHRPSKYPVGRGTPMISPMIQWDHSVEWNIADFSGKNDSRSREDIIEINTAENDAFITGHKIDGRVLFPATGYMTLVWKTFAKINQKAFEEMSVILEDIQFLRATIIPKDGIVRFLVNIFDGSGEFEICESNSVVVRGKITESKGIDKDGVNLDKPPAVDNKYLRLSKDHIYRDLRLRGYDYDGIFRGINNADNYGTVGELEWVDNWISFMDTMLQFYLLNKNTRGLYLPTRIQRVVIDPIKHLSLVETGKGVDVQFYKNFTLIKSGGIEIRGMNASLAPKRQQSHGNPILEQYTFLPYITNKITTIEDALNVAVQIILENISEIKLKIFEIATDKQAEQLMTPTIVKAIQLKENRAIDMTVISMTADNFMGITEPIAVKCINKDLKTEAIIETCMVIAGIGLLNGDHNLDNIIPSIRENGFLLTEEMRDINSDYLNKYGLKLISKITLEKNILYLFRKIEEWISPKFLKVTGKKFDWIEDVKVALKDTVQNGQKYLLVSSGEPTSGILGFFNCLKKEPGGVNFSCLFISSEDIKSFELKKYEEQLKKGLSVNILNNGVWGSYRHLKIWQGESLLKVEHAYIKNTIRGDLSSLRWIESELSCYRPEHDRTKELCTVYYAPLNFRDIMLASGKLPPDAIPGELASQDCILGLEFVGRDSKGHRVMGLVEARGLATSVLTDPVFLWPVPDKWSMEEAATVPTVYATSYYALIVRGKMKSGDSVLIHAGSGGVGQAAISIALHMGCDVFTTVGTQQKREFLLKNFPELNPSHIGNSRDTSFEQMVLEETDGRGVNIVLNSLAEDKLQASVRCLAKHGRFLEIGKLDLSNNSPLGMSVLLKNTTIHGILLDSLFETDCEINEKLQVVRLVNEGIASGAVRPLTFTTFNCQQIEQSFRFMATGKHIGKVILKIRDEEQDKILRNPSTTNSVTAIPRTYMHPDKSYVIVGGLGGFGLELADWLLSRRAKAVILVSRSGVTTGYQSLCLRRWKEKGFNVIVSTRNPATLDAATKLLKEANSIAPVGGIFNLAAVLRDALLENQTVENFNVVCNSKIDTTISLDKASRQHCSQLDYFVVFSSISSGLGNIGQTNYAFANSVMERIIEARQLAGFPGMAIQWGAIGDVGLIMENLKGDNETAVGGTFPQRISSCLSTLDTFLQQMYPVVTSMVPAEKQTSQTSSVSLIDTVMNILGIKDIKSINPANTLADLGMDSLMGTEIKQTLERNFDITLNAAEVRTLTFEKLREFDGESQPETEKQSSEVKSTAQQPEKQEQMVNGSVLTKFQDEFLMPSQNIVKMKDGNGTKDILFVVHPIEGVITDLIEMVSHVHCTVWGLQCTAAAPLKSMQELAAFYVKEVKKVQAIGPYNLCGYSFGASVAFEMGLQLEKQREKCTLILIDGSPDYILSQTEHFKERAKSKNEIAGEADAFAYFICLFSGPENYKKIVEELKALPDLKSRLKLCTEKLRLLTSYTEEDLSNAALSFYNKLVAADSYKPSEIYQGSITLIKAEDYYTKKEHDYGLSKLCKQRVLTHALRCNHRQLIRGETGQQLAQIISNTLQNI